MVTRPPTGSIPELPGSYQFKDVHGRVIYVGKAKNLKRRVNSYFTKNHEDFKTHMLVSKIQYLESSTN